MFLCDQAISSMLPRGYDRRQAIDSIQDQNLRLRRGECLRPCSAMRVQTLAFALDAHFSHLPLHCVSLVVFPHPYQGGPKTYQQYAARQYCSIRGMDGTSWLQMGWSHSTPGNLWLVSSKNVKGVDLAHALRWQEGHCSSTVDRESTVASRYIGHLGSCEFGAGNPGLTTPYTPECYQGITKGFHDEWINCLQHATGPFPRHVGRFSRKKLQSWPCHTFFGDGFLDQIPPNNSALKSSSATWARGGGAGNPAPRGPYVGDCCFIPCCTVLLV